MNFISCLKIKYVLLLTGWKQEQIIICLVYSCLHLPFLPLLSTLCRYLDCKLLGAGTHLFPLFKASSVLMLLYEDSSSSSSSDLYLRNRHHRSNNIGKHFLGTCYVLSILTSWFSLCLFLWWNSGWYTQGSLAVSHMGTLPDKLWQGWLSMCLLLIPRHLDNLGRWWTSRTQV